MTADPRAALEAHLRRARTLAIVADGAGLGGRALALFAMLHGSPEPYLPVMLGAEWLLFAVHLGLSATAARAPVSRQVLVSWLSLPCAIAAGVWSVWAGAVVMHAVMHAVPPNPLSFGIPIAIAAWQLPTIASHLLLAHRTLGRRGRALTEAAQGGPAAF